MRVWVEIMGYQLGSESGPAIRVEVRGTINLDWPLQVQIPQGLMATH